MWFLVKCLMVFALFYVIALADERGNPPAAESKPPGTAVARPDRLSGKDGAVMRLEREATEGLVAAAREKCIAHPRDCAAALLIAGESAVTAPRRH